MGFVDRGGGREAKGSSLRKSKKNPGAAAARQAAHKQAVKPPTVAEDPPALAPNTKEGQYFDAAAALLSRQFETDLIDVLGRSKNTSLAQCCAALIWSADIEKQRTLVTMATDHAGFFYAAVGLHPDNVDRTHQRQFDTWVESVGDLCKMRGCAAIVSGLNLRRDAGTHFPQESLLAAMRQAAVSNHRALVLHAIPKHEETTERLCSIIEEWAASAPAAAVAAAEAPEVGGPRRVGGVPVVLHNFLQVVDFKVPLVQRVAQLGCCITVSAAELHTFAAVPAKCAAFAACLAAIPVGQLLLCTDSPWHTPQTIPDEYIRTQKNEPSNFEYVVAAIREALQGAGEAALSSLLATSGVLAASTAPPPAAGDAAAMAQCFVEALTAHAKINALSVFAIPAVDAVRPVAAAGAAGEGASQEQEDSDSEEDGDSADERNDAAPSSAAAATAAEREYHCKKCRGRLFASADIAVPSDPSLLATSIFLKPQSTTTSVEAVAAALTSTAGPSEVLAALLPPALRAVGEDLECARCPGTTKLGRIALDVVPEGVTFAASGKAGSAFPPGFGIVVISSRVEATESGDVSLAALQRMALAEADRLAQEREAAENASDSDDDDGRKGKRTQKKNVKTNNRSNFTHFRNKNFAPKKEKGATDPATGHTNKGSDDDNDSGAAMSPADSLKALQAQLEKGLGGKKGGQAAANDSDSDDDRKGKKGGRRKKK